jgi:hypothetical protein
MTQILIVYEDTDVLRLPLLNSTLLAMISCEPVMGPRRWRTRPSTSPIWC